MIEHPERTSILDRYSCPICGREHGRIGCDPKVYRRIDRAEETARRVADRLPTIRERPLNDRLDEGFEMLDDDYGRD